MTKILKFILLTLLCLESIAQSVTIDPSSNNSKILEVNSKNKGFMPPKMTTTERIAISNPEIGLLIFDTSKSSLYMYDGQNWLPLLPSNIDASPFLTREPSDDGAYGFGFSTDIEGDWAVIGAPFAYIEGKAYQGAVYLFRKSNGNWLQSTKIIANDGNAGDNFGWSVDLSGNDLVIGATGVNNTAGVVYIYRRTTVSVFGNTANLWLFQTKVTASDSSNYFGVSVAIDGDIAVVSCSPSYKRYVFERINNNWTQTMILQPNFSSNISLSGSYIVLGSNDPYTRKVAVYVKGGGTWFLQTEIIPNSGHIEDGFGSITSISGDYVFIGAPNSYENRGRVYIYQRNANTWTSQAILVLPNNESVPNAYFGGGKIVGDYALVTAKPQGKATIYVYKRTGTNWNLTKKIDSYRTNGNFNLFGVSALSFDETNLIFSDDHFNELGKVFFCNLE
jgi:hypothetical protein